MGTAQNRKLHLTDMMLLALWRGWSLMKLAIQVQSVERVPLVGIFDSDDMAQWHVCSVTSRLWLNGLRMQDSCERRVLSTIITLQLAPFATVCVTGTSLYPLEHPLEHSTRETRGRQ